MNFASAVGLVNKPTIWFSMWWYSIWIIWSSIVGKYSVDGPQYASSSNDTRDIKQVEWHPGFHNEVTLTAPNEVQPPQKLSEVLNQYSFLPSYDTTCVLKKIVNNFLFNNATRLKPR